MAVDQITQRRLVGLGEAIAQARADRSLTQAALAERAGVSVGEIVRLEAGEGEQVRLGAVVDVATAIGLAPSQLLSAGEQRA
jgi:transcriptional regulator with XRE-family HTH domain